MPIIRDGKTPLGRVVECRKSEDSTSPCRTRMMTPEERSYYGEAVPPSEWGDPPPFACMIEGVPQRKAMVFKDDDDFRRKMKSERLRRNMTQHRVGQFAGMSGDIIGKMERGENPLTEEKKRKICKVFGWEVE